jgi:hypothetical protein
VPFATATSFRPARADVVVGVVVVDALAIEQSSYELSVIGVQLPPIIIGVISCFSIEVAKNLNLKRNFIWVTGPRKTSTNCLPWCFQ